MAGRLWGDTSVDMAAPEVTIYTKFGCPYCHRAKALLDSKGATYTEHDITMGGAEREAMMARAPMARTVPQIFIGTTHVGGSDDLAALEKAGKLDALLALADDLREVRTICHCGRKATMVVRRGPDGAVRESCTASVAASMSPFQRASAA